MADYPALPLWTDAYLADTHPELSLEEHGAYMLLLMTAWRRPGCSLPDDDKWFCKLLGIHGNKWSKLRTTVLERFFYRNGQGFWEQKRLRKERDFVEKLKRNGRESAAKRWADVRQLNDLSDANPYAPTPTPTPTPKKVAKDSRPFADANERGLFPDDGAAKSDPPFPKADLLRTWNETCGSALGCVRKLSSTREKHLRKRFLDEFGGQTEAWAAYCRRIRSSPFLTGQGSERGWSANFDWAINETNALKVLEGRYDRRSANGSHAGSSPARPSREDMLAGKVPPDRNLQHEWIGNLSGPVTCPGERKWREVSGYDLEAKPWWRPKAAGASDG